MEEIFDWSDYYTETYGEDVSSTSAVEMRKNLVNLWTAYAQFESGLKQFKKATEVFDKALGDPIVGKTNHIYESYADYWVGRNKLASAQNMFIKGLCAGLPSEESNKLWLSFLEFMHGVNKSKELTLKQLYDAILAKPDVQNLAPITTASRTVSPMMIAPSKTIQSPMMMSINESKESMPTVMPTLPPPVTMPIAPALSTTTTTTTTTITIPPTTTSTTQSSSAISIMNAASFKFEVDFSAEQLLYYFHQYPPVLFVSPDQEPLLSGTNNLSSSESQELETFCNVAIANNTLHYYLDIIESLYYTQALMERQGDQYKQELLLLQHNEVSHISPFTSLVEITILLYIIGKCIKITFSKYTKSTRRNYFIKNT